MYSPIMRKCFGGISVIAMIPWSLVSCHTASQKTGAPIPEEKQVIGDALKELYMAASAAPPQSREQQSVVLRMAEKASNGKELLLVMRAAVGVFPPDAAPERGEGRLRSIVTSKLARVATLNQLIEYATKYDVDPASARPLAERMFQLGADASDPRVWYEIKVAAFHLKAADLERQAQAMGDRLAGR
jgi:hypothetical protein